MITSGSDLYEAARRFAESRKESRIPATQLAERFVRGLKRSELDALALSMVVHIFQTTARRSARTVESEAQRPSAVPLEKKLNQYGEEKLEEPKRDPENVYEREARLKREAASRDRMKKYQEAMESWRNEIRLEVTRELLEVEFSLGDGTTATWGSATVEQHQKRADFLEKMAFGTAETAARHLAAIRMLSEAGVQRLELLPEAAAA